MDKISLYKLSKDVLVELVCKNFNNLSVKEFGQIYRHKYSKEMNKYRDVLKKIYSIGNSLTIRYGKGIIYVEKSDVFYREIYIFDCRIEDEYGDNSAFPSIELLLIHLQGGNVN